MKQKCNHLYKRTKLGKFVIYKCEKPGCPHYIRPELITGKIAECWRCHGVFVIHKKHLELARPHCDDCTKDKKNSLSSRRNPKVEQKGNDIPRVSSVRKENSGDLDWLDADSDLSNVESPDLERESRKKSYQDILDMLRDQ